MLFVLLIYNMKEQPYTGIEIVTPLLLRPMPPDTLSCQEGILHLSHPRSPAAPVDGRFRFESSERRTYSSSNAQSFPTCACGIPMCL